MVHITQGPHHTGSNPNRVYPKTGSTPKEGPPQTGSTPNMVHPKHGSPQTWSTPNSVHPKQGPPQTGSTPNMVHPKQGPLHTGSQNDFGGPLVHQGLGVLVVRRVVEENTEGHAHRENHEHEQQAPVQHHGNQLPVGAALLVAPPLRPVPLKALHDLKNRGTLLQLVESD